jgi:hypothetical protein
MLRNKVDKKKYSCCEKRGYEGDTLKNYKSLHYQKKNIRILARGVNLPVRTTNQIIKKNLQNTDRCGYCDKCSKNGNIKIKTTKTTTTYFPTNFTQHIFLMVENSKDNIL